MLIKNIDDFNKALADGPYAWPGGYPFYFITSDGGALSFEAAKAERRQIVESIARGLDDGWRIVARDVNWEDGDLTCDHTGERIESAYAEPEEASNG